MKASVGDRITVLPARTGGYAQAGTIMELRHPDGSAPYVVRWDDTGETALYFPGSDARLVHADVDDSSIDLTTDAIDLIDAAGLRPVHAPHRTRTWRVEIELVEDGTETTARATLRTGSGKPFEAPHGRSMKAPADSDDPGIGDDVAVARALRHLSDRLLGRAESSMSAVEQRDVTVTH